MATWSPYEPNGSCPWTLAQVTHLHRRAGFAATWPELQRDLADGPEKAVSRLLEGTSRNELVPDDFDTLSSVIGEAAVDSGSVERLQAWWLYRCLFTPHPLQERLTLMWHNHFATSNKKVNDLRSMKRQNDMLRTLSLASFTDLVRAAVRDPALLAWLDAPQNRPGHPNENLARELMELFTLGIGHYTERDVQESARALTGWTVAQGESLFQTAIHDDGEKEILGRVGRWSADDLVTILLEQPAAARRLAWRLCHEFLSDGLVDDAALEELAEGLRQHQLSVRWGVETILRSELFFSPANPGSRIADPVSFVIGPLRALEITRSAPSTLALADWVRRMGQELFSPPNVGGWPGGRSWLSTRTVVARRNYAVSLVEGRLRTPAQPLNPDDLLGRYGAEPTLSAKTSFLSQLLFGKVVVPDGDDLSTATVRLLTSTDAQLQ